MFSTIGAVPVSLQETIQQAHSTIVIQAHPVRMRGRYTLAPTTQPQKSTFNLRVNDFDKSPAAHNLRAFLPPGTNHSAPLDFPINSHRSI
jgi:predicted GTPase